MLRSGNISRKCNAARENYISLKKHQPIRGLSNDWVVRKNHHMKKITTLLVSAAALIASPAVAQDGPSGFDGFHVEALAGYDVVQITIDEEVYGEELSDDLGGFAYGVALRFLVRRHAAGCRSRICRFHRWRKREPCRYCGR
jgi:hypothetical protein